MSLEHDRGGTSILITFFSILSRGVTLPRPRGFSALGGPKRPGAAFHAAWFDVGPTLQAFQSGNLLAQSGDGLFQSRHLAQYLGQQRFKLWTV